MKQKTKYPDENHCRHQRTKTQQGGNHAHHEPNEDN